MAVAVELRTTCPKCGNPVPVNALVADLHCPTCEHAFAFSADVWHQAFSAFTPVALGETDGGPLTLDNGAMLIRAASPPRCRECDTDLPVTNALLAGNSSQISCACGAGVSVRRVPHDLVPGIESYFTHLIGEDAAQLGVVSGAAPDAAEPVIFPCPHCGGSLPVDGTERIVKCSYCSTNAYLPDDLWRRVHPVKTVARWYVWADDDVIAHQKAEAAAASAAAAAEAAAQEESSGVGSGAGLMLLAGAVCVPMGYEGNGGSLVVGAVGVGCLLMGVQGIAVAIGRALEQRSARTASQQDDADEPGSYGGSSVGRAWALAGMWALFLGVWAVAVIGVYGVCLGCLPWAAGVAASGAVIVAGRIVTKLVAGRYGDRRAARDIVWGPMPWLAVGALLAGGALLAVIAARGAATVWDLVPAVVSPSLGYALLLASAGGKPPVRPMPLSRSS